MATVGIEALVKNRGSLRVLDRVTLSVADGEFMVLVGPSGCGKSTLLRCIAGLEQLDGGSITLDGNDVGGLQPGARDLAMVFQSYALYPHLTVRENLSFGLKMRGRPRAEIEARVAEAAEMLGLAALLDRRPHALSGGQRQRVAMGRAIVRRPRAFLFDEPLSNLDAALRTQTRLELKQLHARLGTTTIYVTHDQVEAMTLADRIAVLNQGRLMQVGTPLELYERPANLFVARFLGSPEMNVMSRDQAITAGLLPDPGRGVQRIGVRAEDVVLGAGGVEAQVELVEHLGWEALVHLACRGVRIVARVRGELAVGHGEVVELGLRPERVHLFDDADRRVT